MEESLLPLFLQQSRRKNIVKCKGLITIYLSTITERRDAVDKFFQVRSAFCLRTGLYPCFCCVNVISTWTLFLNLPSTLLSSPIFSDSTPSGHRSTSRLSQSIFVWRQPPPCRWTCSCRISLTFSGQSCQGNVPLPECCWKAFGGLLKQLCSRLSAFSAHHQ